ncbi:MAG TPA: selenocysteine-specific translation elongation factor [Chloroflexota bacterium]
MRVIGTAGHVDHGKSTLIQALTGIDPDRLREEKERGMTIDLGFAWLRLPSGLEASIVDVPGHERFIKNMLAGVGGIDTALLVVAADEGVMPQTREHLAILDLLGIDSGVIAITKRDLVDQDWLDLVMAEVEEVIAPTSLGGARLIPVAAPTGEGLDDLRDELDRLLTSERQRRQTGSPRLPIDRVFTMSGFGTVVTGTLVDGELHLGQDVEIVPTGRKARIRGLQSHRKQVERAPAGTRAAVNLSGVPVEEIERGNVLTSPGWLRATHVVDVRVRVVADGEWALKHNAQVSFHTGALDALGRLALLDSDELKPGESGWAQIRLDRPVPVVKGDLFILRLPAPNLTIGGGMVFDEHPKRHRRFQERVLDQLAVLEKGTPAERVLQALQTREPTELTELAGRLSNTWQEAREMLEPLLASGSIRVITAGSALSPNSLVVSAPGWERLLARVEDELQAYHLAHALRRGMPKEELRTRLSLEPRAFAPVERAILATSSISEDGPFLRLSTHQITLTTNQEQRVEALNAALTGAGASPPSRGDLRTQFDLSDELLQVLIDRGQIVEVGDDLVYTRQTYEQMVERIKQLIVEQGKITVAQARDAFGTSRKYALALLENLDEKRVTRRVGDERVLVESRLTR